MKLTVFFLTALIFLAPLVRADEVVLKNGDHLTGTIVKLDDKKLVLKTDYADTLKIKWQAVQSFSVQKPAVAQTSHEEEKISVASATRKEQTIEIKTPSGQSTTIESGDLKSLRSQSEQAAYERSLHPSLFRGWDGGGNLGLALARGNSQSLSISTGMNLVRPTLNDKITMYSTTVYTKDDKLDAITANAIQGGIRYDRNLNKTIFGYVSADFEYDELQSLDLRSILGSGLGWHAVASNATVFDVLFGGSWTREEYGTGELNNIFAPSVGEQLSHKLTSTSTFTEKAFFYPYVTGAQLGDYRFAFDAGMNTKINSWLSWQTSVSDHYVSNPLPGTRSNDLLLSTGFGVTIPTKK